MGGGSAPSQNVIKLPGAPPPAGYDFAKRMFNNYLPHLTGKPLDQYKGNVDPGLGPTMQAALMGMQNYSMSPLPAVMGQAAGTLGGFMGGSHKSNFHGNLMAGGDAAGQTLLRGMMPQHPGGSGFGPPGGNFQFGANLNKPPGPPGSYDPWSHMPPTPIPGAGMPPSGGMPPPNAPPPGMPPGGGGYVDQPQGFEATGVGLPVNGGPPAGGGVSPGWAPPGAGGDPGGGGPGTGTFPPGGGAPPPQTSVPMPSFDPWGPNPLGIRMGPTGLPPSMMVRGPANAPQPAAPPPIPATPGYQPPKPRPGGKPGRGDPNGPPGGPNLVYDQPESGGKGGI